MDSFEAARAVFARIQTLDPENAHRIVGYILLQEQAEKEMIRLAFGPENQIHSVIAKARAEFCNSSNTSSATSPISISRPNPLPRLHSFNNNNNPSSSSPSSPSVWSVSPSPDSSLSYAAVLNGTQAPQEQSLDGSPEGSQFHHRRSCSVNDIGEDYYSSAKLEAFEQYQQELLRTKLAAQQQRLAMAGVNFPYSKLNFLQREAQRSALMMGEDFNKLNRFRMGRNEVSEMGYGDSAPGARQIYLTFPADSSFKEEDVSNYFSIFGPVQDVRIPYQQKRMFGFVTFVYAETVKIILNKGNPHFVCDSRVLVKPYKEKGKLPDKKQQLMDRSEFSSCSSPTGLDYRDQPFEMHVGPRMFYNNREMLRKKMEQEAAWQQAVEFQSRRLMSMQLLDLKNHAGSPNSSLYQNANPFSNANTENAYEVYADNQGSPSGSFTEELTHEANNSDGSNGNKEDNLEAKVTGLLESFDHILPDGLLASPTKSTAEELNNGVTIPTPSTNNDMLMMQSEPKLKSRFIDIPSLSSGQGAMGM